MLGEILATCVSNEVSPWRTIDGMRVVSVAISRASVSTVDISMSGHVKVYWSSLSLETSMELRSVPFEMVERAVASGKALGFENDARASEEALASKAISCFGLALGLSIMRLKKRGVWRLGDWGWVA
jgi:hypothetical protein